MTGIEVIALLFPAAIATTIHLSKTEKTKVHPILIYINYTIFINLLNFIIVYFLFNHNGFTFTVLFAIKYIILAIINAIILAILTTLIGKYVIIEIEHKKESTRK